MKEQKKLMLLYTQAKSQSMQMLFLKKAVFNIKSFDNTYLAIENCQVRIITWG